MSLQNTLVGLENESRRRFIVSSAVAGGGLAIGLPLPFGASAQSGADGAARDFTQRLVDAGRHYAARTGGHDATIFVILDGENAWEYYHGGGRPFLRALYRALSEASDIQTVTMSEAAAGSARSLPSIFPGSWINGDFYIWIGHRDDHRAWDQLSEARAVFDRRAPQVAPDVRDRAREELLIAEGSDWFWWYGENHEDFDKLFRMHLSNFYTLIGKEIPNYLKTPLSI